MPELPDVQAFKRYFDSTALHQEIAGVEIEAQPDRFPDGYIVPRRHDGGRGPWCGAALE